MGEDIGESHLQRDGLYTCPVLSTVSFLVQCNFQTISSTWQRSRIITSVKAGIVAQTIQILIM